MRLFVLVALGVLAGCGTSPEADIGAAEANQVVQDKNRPPLELPKDIAGLTALGLTLAPDSVLADGEEGLQIEDKALSTTVRAKLYSPGSSAVVAELMLAGLKGARTLGSGEELRLVGKTDAGDSVDVMLGPASGEGRTLVLLYLTREK